MVTATISASGLVHVIAPSGLSRWALWDPGIRVRVESTQPDPTGPTMPPVVQTVCRA